jgi:hypothetical protein
MTNAEQDWRAAVRRAWREQLLDAVRQLRRMADAA